MSIKVIFLAALNLLASMPAAAWDDVGHKISAYIAWQQMTPEVRERAITILRAAAEDSQLATFYLRYGSRREESRTREYLMLASTWADIIRDRTFETRYRKYHHSNWHYSDTFWTVKDGRVEILKAPEEGGLALEKLIEFIKLEQSDAKDAQKAVGLAWLEHLIGDIHQPLHTSARVTDLEPKGDQGANLFLLTPKDTPRDKQENLHWFWDSIIVRNKPNSGDLCDADFVDPLATRIMKKYPIAKLRARLAVDDPEKWKNESFEIASTRLFPADLKRNEMPSLAYKLAALKIAEERLALAGYRMGELFNRLLKEKP